jgi:hypothetical protein
VFASACSGCGFKFAPVFGEVLADMAEGKRPRFSVVAITDATAAIESGTGLLAAREDEARDTKMALRPRGGFRMRLEFLQA